MEPKMLILDGLFVIIKFFVVVAIIVFVYKNTIGAALEGWKDRREAKRDAEDARIEDIARRLKREQWEAEHKEEIEAEAKEQKKLWEDHYYWQKHGHYPDED